MAKMNTILNENTSLAVAGSQQRRDALIWALKKDYDGHVELRYNECVQLRSLRIFKNDFRRNIYVQLIDQIESIKQALSQKYHFPGKRFKKHE